MACGVSIRGREHIERKADKDRKERRGKKERVANWSLGIFSIPWLAAKGQVSRLETCLKMKGCSVLERRIFCGLSFSKQVGTCGCSFIILMRS